MHRVSGYVPFDETLATERLTADEMHAVRAALLEFTDRRSDHPQVGSAWWCLGKFFDADLIPAFAAALQHHEQRASAHLGALGQIMCALGNLDVPICSDGSFAAHDHEQNLADARAWLQANPPRSARSDGRES